MIKLLILSIGDSIGDLVKQGLEILIDPENAITSVIIQLVGTLILFLAVRFLFWDKITKVIEEKKQNATKAFAELEKAKKESAEISKNNEMAFEQAKQEGYQIVERAKQKSYYEAEEIVKKAQITADMKLEDAREQIEKEINKANEQIKKEIIEIAYLLANKIVAKEVDASKHDELIKEFLKGDTK